MKTFRVIALFFIVIAILIMVGPKPSLPRLSNTLPPNSFSINTIEQQIKSNEAVSNLRHDNQARIIWHNDTLKETTPFCLLYLHGFSASWFEAEPTHKQFAAQNGMNCYLHRFPTHGEQRTEPLIDMTADTLYNSAKKALMIARVLGKKVVIMSTSTGGTLALKLAADFPEMVHSLILYSPNIAINDASAWILNKPWGLQIARTVIGSKYRQLTPKNDYDQKYWYNKYRLEALVQLQQLVETTMTQQTFKQIKCPLFLGYYYKDETHQDPTVRVDAMLEMFEQVATKSHLKYAKPFPDAGVHVIANPHFNPNADKVLRATQKFWNRITANY